MGHLRLVMATAKMAIARKVIVLDYDKVSDWHLFGMGALILAHGCAYWFVCRANQTNALPALVTVTSSENKS